MNSKTQTYVFAGIFSLITIVAVVIIAATTINNVKPIRQEIASINQKTSKLSQELNDTKRFVEEIKALYDIKQKQIEALANDIYKTDNKSQANGVILDKVKAQIEVLNSLAQIDEDGKQKPQILTTEEIEAIVNNTKKLEVPPLPRPTLKPDPKPLVAAKPKESLIPFAPIKIEQNSQGRRILSYEKPKVVNTASAEKVALNETNNYLTCPLSDEVKKNLDAGAWNNESLRWVIEYAHRYPKQQEELLLTRVVNLPHSLLCYYNIGKLHDGWITVALRLKDKTIKNVGESWQSCDGDNCYTCDNRSITECGFLLD